MRAHRLLLPVVVPLMAIGLVSGCWGGDGDDPPEEAPNGSSSESSEPEGPSPEELSQQVLDAAVSASSGATPIGTATGTTKGGQLLTVDVLSIRRTDDGTLVTLRMSGEETYNLGIGLTTERYASINFAQALFLEDPTVTKTRFLPLQFDDERTGRGARCACPYIPLEIGPEPQTVTALYPELPAEVTTVTVHAADTEISIPSLPVEG